MGIEVLGDTAADLFGHVSLVLLKGTFHVKDEAFACVLDLPRVHLTLSLAEGDDANSHRGKGKLGAPRFVSFPKLGAELGDRLSPS